MGNDSAGININSVPRMRYPAVGLHGHYSRLMAAGFDVGQAGAIIDMLGALLSRQAVDEQVNYQHIERRMNSEIAPFSTTKTTAPLPTTVSRKYRVRFGGLLSEVTAELNTAGTTDTIYDVLVNGVVVYTITIEANNTEDIYLPDPDDVVRVYKGDLITVQVTTAGTGAIGLSVLGWVSH